MSKLERSVTILTEYFHPEEASTAQLLTQLSTGLTDAFDMSVLTGYPNYHESDRDTSVPKRESYEGVDIERVQATRFDKDRTLGRVANWLTFTVLVCFRLLRSRGSDDTLVVLSNPPILPLAAWISKRIRGTSYVYLIYDVYPDMAVKLGYLSEDSIIVRLWERFNRAIYRDADRIVVLGNSMENQVVRKMGSDSDFDPGKIEVVHNWEDESFIEPIAKEKNSFAREQGTVEPFTVVYSGNIGRFHELETVIDAIDRLDAQGRDVKFLIIGEGARKSELQEYVSRNDIDAVDFLPFQPLDRLPKSLTCGDASLVGIKEGMKGLCVSSKLYSSLAAGRPVLAVVGQGDEVEVVVRECDCGIHVEPGDITGCVEAIKQWIDEPQLRDQQGQNARQCLEERFSFAESRDRYKRVLEEVTKAMQV